jgi:hypothetical protein
MMSATAAEPTTESSVAGFSAQPHALTHHAATDRAYVDVVGFYAHPMARKDWAT